MFTIGVGVLEGKAVKVLLIDWLVAEAKMLETAVLVRAIEEILVFVAVGLSVPVTVLEGVGVMVPVRVMVGEGV